MIDAYHFRPIVDDCQAAGHGGVVAGALSRCSSLSSINTSSGVDVESPLSDTTAASSSLAALSRRHAALSVDADRPSVTRRPVRAALMTDAPGRPCTAPVDIDAARRELEWLIVEQQRLAEVAMEKEDELYQLHESRVVEVAAQRRQMDELNAQYEVERRAAMHQLELERCRLDELHGGQDAVSASELSRADGPPSHMHPSANIELEQVAVEEKYSEQMAEIRKAEQELCVVEERYKREDESRIEKLSAQNWFVAKMDVRKVQLMYFIELHQQASVPLNWSRSESDLNEICGSWPHDIYSPVRRTASSTSGRLLSTPDSQNDYFTGLGSTPLPAWKEQLRSAQIASPAGNIDEKALLLYDSPSDVHVMRGWASDTHTLGAERRSSSAPRLSDAGSASSPTDAVLFRRLTRSPSPRGSRLSNLSLVSVPESIDEEHEETPISGRLSVSEIDIRQHRFACHDNRNRWSSLDEDKLAGPKTSALSHRSITRGKQDSSIPDSGLPSSPEASRLESSPSSGMKTRVRQRDAVRRQPPNTLKSSTKPVSGSRQKTDASVTSHQNTRSSPVKKCVPALLMQAKASYKQQSGTVAERSNQLSQPSKPKIRSSTSCDGKRSTSQPRSKSKLSISTLPNRYSKSSDRKLPSGTAAAAAAPKAPKPAKVRETFHSFREAMKMMPGKGLKGNSGDIPVEIFLPKQKTVESSKESNDVNDAGEHLLAGTGQQIRSHSWHAYRTGAGSSESSPVMQRNKLEAMDAGCEDVGLFSDDSLNGRTFSSPRRRQTADFCYEHHGVPVSDVRYFLTKSWQSRRATYLDDGKFSDDSLTEDDPSYSVSRAASVEPSQKPTAVLLPCHAHSASSSAVEHTAQNSSEVNASMLMEGPEQVLVGRYATELKERWLSCSNTDLSDKLCGQDEVLAAADVNISPVWRDHISAEQTGMPVEPSQSLDDTTSTSPSTIGQCVSENKLAQRAAAAVSEKQAGTKRDTRSRRAQALRTLGKSTESDVTEGMQPVALAGVRRRGKRRVAPTASNATEADVLQLSSDDYATSSADISSSSTSNEDTDEPIQRKAAVEPVLDLGITPALQIPSSASVNSDSLYSSMKSWATDIDVDVLSLASRQQCFEHSSKKSFGNVSDDHHDSALQQSNLDASSSVTPDVEQEVTETSNRDSRQSVSARSSTDTRHAPLPGDAEFKDDTIKVDAGPIFGNEMHSSSGVKAGLSADYTSLLRYKRKPDDDVSSCTSSSPKPSEMWSRVPAHRHGMEQRAQSPVNSDHDSAELHHTMLRFADAQNRDSGYQSVSRWSTLLVQNSSSSLDETDMTVADDAFVGPANVVDNISASENLAVNSYVRSNVEIGEQSVQNVNQSSRNKQLQLSLGDCSGTIIDRCTLNGGNGSGGSNARDAELDGGYSQVAVTVDSEESYDAPASVSSQEAVNDNQKLPQTEPSNASTPVHADWQARCHGNDRQVNLSRPRSQSVSQHRTESFTTGEISTSLSLSRLRLQSSCDRNHLPDSSASVDGQQQTEVDRGRFQIVHFVEPQLRSRRRTNAPRLRPVSAEASPVMQRLLKYALQHEQDPTNVTNQSEPANILSTTQSLSGECLSISVSRTNRAPLVREAAVDDSIHNAAARAAATSSPPLYDAGGGLAEDLSETGRLHEEQHMVMSTVQQLEQGDGGLANVPHGTVLRHVLHDQRMNVNSAADRQSEASPGEVVCAMSRLAGDHMESESGGHHLDRHPFVTDTDVLRHQENDRLKASVVSSHDGVVSGDNSLVTVPVSTDTLSSSAHGEVMTVSGSTATSSVASASWCQPQNAEDLTVEDLRDTFVRETPGVISMTVDAENQLVDVVGSAQHSTQSICTDANRRENETQLPRSHELETFPGIVHNRDDSLSMAATEEGMLSAHRQQSHDDDNVQEISGSQDSVMDTSTNGAEMRNSQPPVVTVSTTNSGRREMQVCADRTSVCADNSKVPACRSENSRRIIHRESDDPVDNQQDMSHFDNRVRSHGIDTEEMARLRNDGDAHFTEVTARVSVIDEVVCKDKRHVDNDGEELCDVETDGSEGNVDGTLRHRPEAAKHPGALEKPVREGSIASEIEQTSNKTTLCDNSAAVGLQGSDECAIDVVTEENENIAGHAHADRASEAAGAVEEASVEQQIRNPVVDTSAGIHTHEAGDSVSSETLQLQGYLLPVQSACDSLKAKEMAFEVQDGSTESKTANIELSRSTDRSESSELNVLTMPVINHMSNVLQNPDVDDVQANTCETGNRLFVSKAAGESMPSSDSSHIEDSCSDPKPEEVTEDRITVNQNVEVSVNSEYRTDDFTAGNAGGNNEEITDSFDERSIRVKESSECVTLGVGQLMTAENESIAAVNRMSYDRFESTAAQTGPSGRLSDSPLTDATLDSVASSGTSQMISASLELVSSHNSDGNIGESVTGSTEHKIHARCETVETGKEMTAGEQNILNAITDDDTSVSAVISPISSQSSDDRQVNSHVSDTGKESDHSIGTTISPSSRATADVVESALSQSIALGLHYPESSSVHSVEYHLIGQAVDENGHEISADRIVTPVSDHLLAAVDAGSGSLVTSAGTESSLNTDTDCTDRNGMEINSGDDRQAAYSAAIEISNSVQTNDTQKQGLISDVIQQSNSVSDRSREEPPAVQQEPGSTVVQTSETLADKCSNRDDVVVEYRGNLTHVASEVASTSTWDAGSLQADVTLTDMSLNDAAFSLVNQDLVQNAVAVVRPHSDFIHEEVVARAVAMDVSHSDENVFDSGESDAFVIVEAADRDRVLFTDALTDGIVNTAETRPELVDETTAKDTIGGSSIPLKQSDVFSEGYLPGKGEPIHTQLTVHEESGEVLPHDDAVVPSGHSLEQPVGCRSAVNSHVCGEHNAKSASFSRDKGQAEQTVSLDVDQPAGHSGPVSQFGVAMTTGASRQDDVLIEHTQQSDAALSATSDACPVSLRGAVAVCDENSKPEEAVADGLYDTDTNEVPSQAVVHGTEEDKIVDPTLIINSRVEEIDTGIASDPTTPEIAVLSNRPVGELEQQTSGAVKGEHQTNTESPSELLVVSQLLETSNVGDSVVSAVDRDVVPSDRSVCCIDADDQVIVDDTDDVTQVDPHGLPSATVRSHLNGATSESSSDTTSAEPVSFVNSLREAGANSEAVDHGVSIENVTCKNLLQRDVKSADVLTPASIANEETAVQSVSSLELIYPSGSGSVGYSATVEHVEGVGTDSSSVIVAITCSEDTASTGTMETGGRLSTATATAVSSRLTLLQGNGNRMELAISSPQQSVDCSTHHVPADELVEMKRCQNTEELNIVDSGLSDAGSAVLLRISDMSVATSKGTASLHNFEVTSPRGNVPDLNPEVTEKGGKDTDRSSQKFVSGAGVNGVGDWLMDRMADIAAESAAVESAHDGVSMCRNDASANAFVMQSISTTAVESVPTIGNDCFSDESGYASVAEQEPGKLSGAAGKRAESDDLASSVTGKDKTVHIGREVRPLDIPEIVFSGQDTSHGCELIDDIRATETTENGVNTAMDNGVIATNEVQQSSVEHIIAASAYGETEQQSCNEETMNVSDNVSPDSSSVDNRTAETYSVIDAGGLSAVTDRLQLVEVSSLGTAALAGDSHAMSGLPTDEVASTLLTTASPVLAELNSVAGPRDVVANLLSDRSVDVSAVFDSSFINRATALAARTVTTSSLQATSNYTDNNEFVSEKTRNAEGLMINNENVAEARQHAAVHDEEINAIEQNQSHDNSQPYCTLTDDAQSSQHTGFVIVSVAGGTSEVMEQMEDISQTVDESVVSVSREKQSADLSDDQHQSHEDVLMTTDPVEVDGDDSRTSVIAGSSNMLEELHGHSKDGESVHRDSVTEFESAGDDGYVCSDEYLARLTDSREETLATISNASAASSDSHVASLDRGTAYNSAANAVATELNVLDIHEFIEGTGYSMTASARAPDQGHGPDKPEYTECEKDSAAVSGGTRMMAKQTSSSVEGNSDMEMMPSRNEMPSSEHTHSSPEQLTPPKVDGHECNTRTEEVSISLVRQQPVSHPSQVESARTGGLRPSASGDASSHLKPSTQSTHLVVDSDRLRMQVRSDDSKVQKPRTSHLKIVTGRLADTEVLGIDLEPENRLCTAESPEPHPSDVEIIMSGHSTVGYGGRTDFEYQSIGLQPVGTQRPQFTAGPDQVLRDDVSEQYPTSFWHSALDVEIRPRNEDDSQDIGGQQGISVEPRRGVHTNNVGATDSHREPITLPAAHRNDVVVRSEMKDHVTVIERSCDDGTSRPMNTVAGQQNAEHRTTAVSDDDPLVDAVSRNPERCHVTINRESSPLHCSRHYSPSLPRNHRSQIYNIDLDLFRSQSAECLHCASAEHSHHLVRSLSDRHIGSTYKSRRRRTRHKHGRRLAQHLSANSSLSKSDQELLGSTSALFEDLLPNFKDLPFSSSVDVSDLESDDETLHGDEFGLLDNLLPEYSDISLKQDNGMVRQTSGHLLRNTGADGSSRTQVLDGEIDEQKLSQKMVDEADARHRTMQERDAMSAKDQEMVDDVVDRNQSMDSITYVFVEHGASSLEAAVGDIQSGMVRFASQPSSYVHGDSMDTYPHLSTHIQGYGLLTESSSDSCLLSVDAECPTPRRRSLSYTDANDQSAADGGLSGPDVWSAGQHIPTAPGWSGSEHLPDVPKTSKENPFLTSDYSEILNQTDESLVEIDTELNFRIGVDAETQTGQNLQLHQDAVNGTVDHLAGGSDGPETIDATWTQGAECAECNSVLHSSLLPMNNGRQAQLSAPGLSISNTSAVDPALLGTPPSDLDNYRRVSPSGNEVFSHQVVKKSHTVLNLPDDETPSWTGSLQYTIDEQSPAECVLLSSSSRTIETQTYPEMRVIETQTSNECETTQTADMHNAGQGDQIAVPVSVSDSVTSPGLLASQTHKPVNEVFSRASSAMSSQPGLSGIDIQSTAMSRNDVQSGLPPAIGSSHSVLPTADVSVTYASCGSDQSGTTSVLQQISPASDSQSENLSTASGASPGHSLSNEYNICMSSDATSQTCSRLSGPELQLESVASRGIVFSAGIGTSDSSIVFAPSSWTSPAQTSQQTVSEARLLMVSVPSRSLNSSDICQDSAGRGLTGQDATVSYDSVSNPGSLQSLSNTLPPASNSELEVLKTDDFQARCSQKAEKILDKYRMKRTPDLTHGERVQHDDSTSSPQYCDYAHLSPTVFHSQASSLFSHANDSGIVDSQHSPSSSIGTMLGRSETMHNKSTETDSVERVDAVWDDELERLLQDRQHIIDVLAREVIPSRIQVELIEAHLNYLIGQTDAILQHTDDPAVSQHHSQFLGTDFQAMLEASERQIQELIRQLETTRNAPPQATNVQHHRERHDAASHKGNETVEEHLRPIERYCNSPVSRYHSSGWTPSQREEFLLGIRREIVSATTSRMRPAFSSASPLHSRAFRRHSLRTRGYLSAHSSVLSVGPNDSVHEEEPSVGVHSSFLAATPVSRTHFARRRHSTLTSPVDDAINLLLSECQEARQRAQVEVNRAVSVIQQNTPPWTHRPLGLSSRQLSSSSPVLCDPEHNESPLSSRAFSPPHRPASLHIASPYRLNSRHADVIDDCQPAAHGAVRDFGTRWRRSSAGCSSEPPVTPVRPVLSSRHSTQYNPSEHSQSTNSKLNPRYTR